MVRQPAFVMIPSNKSMQPFTSSVDSMMQAYRADVACGANSLKIYLHTANYPSPSFHDIPSSSFQRVGDRFASPQ